MLFVVGNRFVSAILRGEHIADELGVRCYFQNVGDEREAVFFVKETSRALVEAAKERGCRIIYEPLDWFCYLNNRIDFGDLVDVVIVHSRESTEFYAEECPRARFALIPHQWDARLTTMAPQDKFRAGYIGKGFNCPREWVGAKATLSDRMLSAAAQYNLHVSGNARDAKNRLLKPATKVVTAAGVGANVVVYNDPSAVELLGDTYPYLARDGALGDALRRAQRDFGGPAWKRGREVMAEVRERTSLKAIAALYRRLGEGDESLLFEPMKSANRIAA